MMVAMRDLPTGTVTFLFTDIEGSSKLLHELGAEAFAEALLEHRRVVRDAFGGHGGVEVDTQGDAFFVAFPTAPGALRAAAEATQRLTGGPIRVRMGLHTGTPRLTEEGYVGPDVHRAARIAAAGHGGQVLVSASTATLVGNDGLRDLGEHRLKDLSAPERIHQLGDDDFPPLKSLWRTNLPVPSTPFLGRDRELAEVVEIVSRSDVRIVTLTGPGGTGKTRLAGQAAGEIGPRYPDGVWWVPLAPLRDAALVLPTAGQALGARDGLAEHIADRSMLLVLDNFEQVIDAATDVAGLVAACPNVDLLVTSRETLHISGEQEYPVPPLAPDEAVQLFTARARAARPDFQPDEHVAAICRRLDDLPLALELAAARVKVLSPTQIIERLEQRLPLLTGGARDVPERQRTLRGAIEWSHDLLTTDEQRLFARLAVFRGGCTPEAAEAAAGADLDTLGSLVDKSLLRQREDRFWMLETIREYAAERLEASGETNDLRRRHAELFLAIAEEAELHLRDDSSEWADRLEREHDNIRVALDHLEASRDTQATLRLAGAVSRFWYMKSHLTEGRRRLESALAADGRPTTARGKALNGAAVMALNVGDSSAARSHAEEALATHRELGEAWAATYSGMMIGNALAEGHDLATAKPILEEAVKRFRELGDAHYATVTILNLAWVVGELGDHERERALHQEALEQARALRIERLEGAALAQLSIMERDDGRFADASSMLKQGLRISHRLGDRLDVAIGLGRLASILVLLGQAELAARLVASSEALTEQIGARTFYWAAERNEQTLAAIRAQLDGAALEAAWDQGRAMTMDEAMALAMESPSEAPG